jgi:hypothetical protein
MGHRYSWEGVDWYTVYILYDDEFFCSVELTPDDEDNEALVRERADLIVSALNHTLHEENGGEAG